MKQLFKNIYLKKRFFIVLVSLVIGFLVSYIFPDLYGVFKIAFYLFILALLVDLLLVFGSKGKISGERIIPDKLSNGDDNDLKIRVINRYLFKTNIKIIDELPHQFQKRDFGIETKIDKG